MPTGNAVFSNQDVVDIVNEANSALGKDGEEKTKKQWQILQEKANNLIMNYDLALLNQERVKWTRISKQDLMTKTPEFIAEYNRKKQLFFEQLANLHKIYPIAFDFDDVFTRYRGELPKQVAYVVIVKGVPKTYVMSLTELAEKASLQNRIFISEKKLQAEQKQVLEEILLQNAHSLTSQQEMEEHIDYAKAAYTGTYNRLQRFLQVRKQYQAQGMLLLFKVGNIWEIARVINIGDVKEAYVAALMAEHKKDCLCINGAKGFPDYYDHNLIQMFFLKYIHNVTNRPAIIEEDVRGLGFQFAVKGRGANLPSLEQYVNAAREVMRHTNPMSQEEIKNYLATQDVNTFRNNLVTDINDLTDQELEILYQYLSQK